MFRQFISWSAQLEVSIVGGFKLPGEACSATVISEAFSRMKMAYALHAVRDIHMRKFLSNTLVSVAALSVLLGCELDNDTAALVEPLETGLQPMEWVGNAPGCEEGCARSYYIQLPTDYVASDGNEPLDVTVNPLAAEPKPLLIAFHGTNGSHERWTNNEIGYDLVEPVGDGAIMVFPNALAGSDGGQQWRFSYDLDFFLDLLAELDRRGLNYDPERIFVTGHSSGGGMAHEVGCRFGDIIRAIAPSAGTLIGTNCIGAVAVLMSQGKNDALVKYDIATGARRYWTLYNGYNLDASVPTELPPCVDYSLLGAANTPYPVYWCEHTEGSLDDFSGHRWASFTGAAVWDFFNSLPPKLAGRDVTAPPPNGGNERAAILSDTTITFRLKYPDDIARPLDGAISLYPEDYLENPSFAIPSVFLSTLFPVGQPGPGDTVEYTVPISFFVFSGPEVEFPSTWTLGINIYVDGGTRPTPTPGLDHQVQLLFTFSGKNDVVVIDDVLELVPASCFFGCDE
jgi:predicted esterase